MSDFRDKLRNLVNMADMVAAQENIYAVEGSEKLDTVPKTETPGIDPGFVLEGVALRLALARWKSVEERQCHQSLLNQREQFVGR